MEIVLLIIHILICITLIVSILLQASKGGGLAGAFGGSGASGAILGSTGTASFLSKLTTYLAAVFFLTCLGLYYASTDDALPETAAEQAIMGETGPVPLHALPQTGGKGSAETTTPAPASSEERQK
mgnify:CR=1 FL=1